MFRRGAGVPLAGKGCQPKVDPPLAETVMKKDSKDTVYVLYSKLIKKRDIGFTGNLERRITQRNRGNSKFTKRGVPWNLIYHEIFEIKSEALKREIFLKTGQGRLFLDKLDLK